MNRVREEKEEERPSHVVISGSHGLVGSALLSFLAGGSHRITRLVRGASPRGASGGSTAGVPAPAPSASASAEVPWAPASGIHDLAPLEGADAVVHLAGESLAAGRWTPARKAEIRRSRVEGTRNLCESLARLACPPGALVSASAIGIYGDRGDEPLDESSTPGEGFLAEVCRGWEAATEPAARAGVRVVHLRFGLILSTAGGALPKMLPPFKLGLGGKIGSGRQSMSWIAIDDAVGAIVHAIRTRSLSGPVNAVSPAAVTNAEFTDTLARVLSRPAIAPFPAFAARLAFGEMADELLLASARVVPRRLTESAYRFRYPELEGALRHVLGN